MATETKSRERVVFGDFQLDCRTGELRRSGAALKIPPQPAKVLSILVRRAGEIVTREELAQQVWGSDTYVDFEHGLNFAIRKIRSTLGDDAENPRYLETIPKRGYRFIAEVSLNGHQPAPPDHERGPRKSVRWMVVLASLGAVLAVAAVTVYLRQTQRPLQKAPIVLGEFANHTGDTVFDETLRQGLSVQLEQSPYVRLISDDQIHETLRLMGRRSGAALSPEISREVCQRSNAAVTVAGSIDMMGTRYALNLRALDCSNGDLLAGAQAQAEDKNHVLEALSKMASDLRERLGEPLSSLTKYNVPLANVTTSSLEALRCYTQGMQVLTKEFDYTESLSWFQKATELDPNFAMAYWSIGDVHAILGETNSAVEYTRKAFQLRDRVSEREKALIEANYYYYVLGDVESARRACEYLGKLYPFSEDAHNSVAVFAETLGEYDVGLSEYQEALRLSPRSSFLYRDVAYTYLALERINDASETVRRAHALDLDSNLAAVRYSIAFYRNDPGEMARQAASALGKPEVEHLLLALDADTAAYMGQLGRARELSRRAAESAEREGKRETSALYYAAAAVREALLEKSSTAQEQAMIASQHPGGRDVAYGIALALLYAGNLTRGESATEGLAKRFPEDTVVKCNYLPVLRAKLAIMHGNPQRAIETLATAEQCELGLPVYSYYNWPNLYPAYVRGEAYLAAHRASEAAAEFEKVIAHRGIVLNEPIGALAHLQAGRASALAGDVEKAGGAYRDFLALWKDADADLPILRQAKAEYAKLSHRPIRD